MGPYSSKLSREQCFEMLSHLAGFSGGPKFLFLWAP